MSIMVDLTKLQSGDIVAVQSKGLFGKLHHYAMRRDTLLNWHSDMPSRPSSHNGIFSYDKNMNPVIFEATFGGFVATPIQEYEKLVINGQCELKFLRVLNGLSPQKQMEARAWCMWHLKTKYDFQAYASLIWRLSLRMPAIWNSENKARFWCTEACAKLYQYLKYDIFPEMPCPYMVEKMTIEYILVIIEEWYMDCQTIKT